MTKQHDIGHYLDGRVQVAYCKRCSAEGQKLFEDCPQKISVEDLEQLEGDLEDKNRG